MIHKCKCILPKLVGLGLIVAGICLAANGTAFGQGTKTVNAALSNAHQPLYEAYRGVRIGMTAEEVRRKLGAPTHIAGNQDLYMISDNETAQIAYDNSHQVITISADYMGGVGAPDYKAVVGPDIETQADGSLYKIVWYKSAGFWVSYNRTAGTLPFVTVTIQKIK